MKVALFFLCHFIILKACILPGKDLPIISHIYHTVYYYLIYVVVREKHYHKVYFMVKSPFSLPIFFIMPKKSTRTLRGSKWERT